MKPTLFFASGPASHLLGAALLALLVASGACACKSGSKTGGGTAGPGNGSDTADKGDPAECEKARDKVRSFYEKEAAATAKPDDSEKVRALRSQIVEDNTEMVMIDCRARPARFAPCLQRATSVEQMERECLIPLDDEGKVEGKAFAAE
jgi:hypothetical protein